MKMKMKMKMKMNFTPLIRGMSLFTGQDGDCNRIIIHNDLMMASNGKMALVYRLPVRLQGEDRAVPVYVPRMVTAKSRVLLTHDRIDVDGDSFPLDAVRTRLPEVIGKFMPAALSGGPCSFDLRLAAPFCKFTQLTGDKGPAIVRSNGNSVTIQYINIPAWGLVMGIRNATPWASPFEGEKK